MEKETNSNKTKNDVTKVKPKSETKKNDKTSSEKKKSSSANSKDIKASEKVKSTKPSSKKDSETKEKTSNGNKDDKKNSIKEEKPKTNKKSVSGNKEPKKVERPKLVKVKKKGDKNNKGSKKPKLSVKNPFKRKKTKTEEKPQLTKKELNKLEKKKIKEKNKERNANKDIIRRKKRITKRAISAFAVSGGTFAVVAVVFMLCGALLPNAGLAMRIDDYKLTESQLTDYISNSTVYASYKKSASNWASYLGNYSMTASTFRNQVIESKFKEDELIRRACEEKGIEVTDEEVDAHVDSFKNKFSTDSAYKDALDKMGYTPETYWENTKQSMLKEKLSNQECPTDNPADSDVVTYLSSYKSTYSGAKQSSSILIKDKTKAQEVLDKIKNGEITFEDAVTTYSEDENTKAKGGDMGWDKVSSHVAGYDSALNSISKDEVGGTLANCGDGYRIIKCTDVWTAGDKIESLDGIPSPIVEYCRTKKKESNQQTSLTTWLDNFAKEQGISIEIYPMPDYVPYNVTAKSSTTSSSSSPITTTGDGTVTTTDGDGTTTTTSGGTTTTTSSDGTTTTSTN